MRSLLLALPFLLVACERPSETPTTAGPGRTTGPVEQGGPAGPKARGKGYEVTVKVPEQAAVGAEVVATVVLEPRDGFKLNAEFPTELAVKAPSGVEVAKATQENGDAVSFTEKEGQFAVKFKSAAAGDKSFTADFKFAVCTETTCDPKLQALAWSVPVK